MLRILIVTFVFWSSMARAFTTTGRPGPLGLLFRRDHVSVFISGSDTEEVIKTQPQSFTGTIADDPTDDAAARVWRQLATNPDPSEHDNVLLKEKLQNHHLKGLLVGTYYVNGLASCAIGDRLVHPFESHGFLKAIEFTADGTVRLNAKFVQTPVRTWEKRLDRPLFRGAMSQITNVSTVGGQVLNALSPTTRETANLAVRAWPQTTTTTTTTTRPGGGGRDLLFVSADHCPFYQMDPETLATLGVTDLFSGALRGHSGMVAHTRVDNFRNRLVTCALQYEPMDQATVLTFHEFDGNGTLVGEPVQHRLSPAVVLHDWSLTEHYYVLPAATAQFDLQKLPSLLLGKSTATDIFKVDETVPATCILIPRPGTEAYQQDARPIYATLADGRHGVVFHMGPAYETLSSSSSSSGNGDGSDSSSTTSSLKVFPFVFDKYQFGGEMGFRLQQQEFAPTPWSNSNGGPKLERWEISMDQQVVSASSKDDTTSNNRRTATIVATPYNPRVISDMPTFHPGRDGGKYARYVYTVCGLREEGWFPFNAVAKHDLETGDVEIWPPQAAAIVNSSNNKNKDALWDGGSAVYAEPLFVPKEYFVAGDVEDNGWVLTTVHDTAGNTTTLEIFDAANFGSGPVETIQLADELWGWNVHSTFVPGVLSRQEQK